MKRHHLSFKGTAQDTVAEIRHYLAHLSDYLAAHPACIEVQLGALAEGYVTLAGEAMEAQSLEGERVRAQLVEMREAIALRQVRPEMTALELHVLGVVISHSSALSTNDILAQTHLPRSTLISCLRSLQQKGRLVRELRHQLLHWSPTEKGREYKPPEKSGHALAAALPAAAILPMQTAMSIAPWQPRAGRAAGRGPSKR